VQQVIVITGAGSGLGASLAKKYSNQGSHVVLLGRNSEKLANIANTLSHDHSIYTADVSSRKTCSRSLSQS
jgi:short-subunit dehydrogenase